MTNTKNNKWASAALVAPIAATMFGGTVAFVMHNQPQVTTEPVTTVAQTKVPEVVVVSQASDPRLAEIEKLQGQLTKLQKQTKAAKRAAAQAAAQAASGGSSNYSSGGSATSSGSGNYSSGSNSGSGGGSSSGGSYSAPVQQAPAPPTQGSTGASGAK